MGNLNGFLRNSEYGKGSVFGGVKPKKKRVKPTASDRIYVWANPRIYGRACSICGERITNISDMELDHTRSHKVGGTKMRLSHRSCNRKKGSKGLRHIQKRLGLKSTIKRKTRSDKGKKKRRRPSGILNYI